MVFDWNLLSAWAAIITAIAAIAAFWWQSKLTRMTMNFEYLWRLDDQFTGNDKLLKKRKKVATSLLEGKFDNNVEDILDFFETVAQLINKRVIDRDLASGRFHHWAVRYWLVSKDHVELRRKTLQSPMLWKNYENWTKRMLVMDNPFQIQTSNRLLDTTNESLHEFLIEESTIDI